MCNNIGICVFCQVLFSINNVGHIVSAITNPNVREGHQQMYCTYITIYSGNKLPPFYIGSTSIKKINSGYIGSVSSNEFKKIWDVEAKINSHLFKTKIITYHKTRKEATEKELFFQIKLNVVKSPLYINKSLAKPNGFFGMDVNGENNPRFGHSWGDNHPKGMLGKKHSEKTKEKMKLDRKGKHTGSKNAMFGIKRSEEWRKNRSLSMAGKKRGPYKKSKQS